MAHQLDEKDSENYRKLARFYISLCDYKYGMCIGEMLEQLGDVNYQFPENAFRKSRKSDVIGSTALFMAETFKRKDYFDSLLQKGADFTIKNREGSTVLHHSLKYPLENFKGINWRHGSFQAKVTDERTSEFAVAVLAAHVQSKNPTNPSDNNGITHFHVACLLDHSQAVEFFVNSGIPIDQAVNEDSPVLAGDTPLHVAAICGCLDTTKVLLKNGASKSAKNAKRMTPLQSVVSRNMEIADWMHTRDRTIFCFSELKSEIDAKAKIINLLITENVDGNSTIDEVGFSFLHAAATLKDTSFVERLLEKGLDVNHCIEMDSPVWPGYTALHFAAHFNIEMVKFLVSKGANLEAKDAHGVTPFDMCIERFDLEDLHDILSSHAIWKDIELSDGTTKLVDLIYIMRDPEQLSTFLESKELDVNLFVPRDSPLWPGCTVLHLAAMFTETIKIVDDHLYRDNDDESDCWSMGSDREERLQKRPRQTMTCTQYIRRLRICVDADADVTAKDARDSTPLHLAFRRQAFDAVRLMLEHHPENVNPKDKDNLSHLYIASYVGDASLVEKLLSLNDVDTNMPLSSTFRWHENEDSFVRKYRSLGFKSGGSTPLHAAVISGDNTVELLLKHGADVNASDENGLTPLHVIFSNNWNHEIAKMLLASPNLKNCVFNGSLTHLHLAISFSHLGAIEKLLDDGANVDAVIDVTPNDVYKVYDQWSHQPLAFMLEYAGCTPLHMAMGLHPRMGDRPYGNPNVARLLLQRGADMFVANSVGRKVAYMSLTRRYLERYEDVEITHLQNDVASQRRMVEDSGITMLHIACWKVDVEAVEALLNGGADVNAQAHADSPVWPGWTPMHVLILMAANSKIDSGKIDAIMRMLLDGGADVTIPNADLETPLHLTEPEKLSVEIVSHVKYRSYADSPYAGLLLDRLKDDNANPCNIDGISYFHIACLRNDVKHVTKFLQQGVEVNKQIDYFSNRYPGCTALHLAVNPDSSVDESSKIATVELLVKHGADVHARDIYGNTPLHLAVKDGADADPLGFTYVSQRQAAKRGPPPVALLDSILSAGADINATNILGERAFDLLLRSEKFKNEDIKYFLRRGCQLNSYLTSTNSYPGEGYLGILSTHPLVKEIIQNWEDVLDIDSIGRTAIHNIVSIKNSRVDDYTKLIGPLMSRGCDIDRQDKHGRTALHLAVRFLNYKAISALVKLSADVNVIDEDGKTALARIVEYYGYSIKSTPRFLGISYPLQVAKCLAIYIYKMQLCGLNVHEDNIKTLADIPQHSKEDEDVVKRCDEELKKAKTTKISSSQLTFYDFLSDTRAWESLPVVLDKWPCPVDELFGTINNRLVCYEFPELLDILGLQYRKFQKLKIRSNL